MPQGNAAVALLDHGGDAGDAVMARWLQSAGLQHLASPLASTAIDHRLLPNLLMQGWRTSNCLFYLSVPPNIFKDAVKCASLSSSSSNGWTRVIVEKPFGRDSESSAALRKSLKHYLRIKYSVQLKEIELHPLSVQLTGTFKFPFTVLSLSQQKCPSSSQNARCNLILLRLPANCLADAPQQPPILPAM